MTRKRKRQTPLGEEIVSTIRNDGLYVGEMSGPQIKETMFGANQHMTKFIWDEGSNELLHKFMGTDIEPRKEFLFNEVDFSNVVE